jgi:hypothetical protein
MISRSVKTGKDKKVKPRKKVDTSSKSKKKSRVATESRKGNEKNSDEVTLRLYITTQCDWEMLNKLLKKQFPKKCHIERIDTNDVVTQAVNLYWRNTEGANFIVDINGWKPAENLYKKWKIIILNGTFFENRGTDTELTEVENTLCSASSAFKYTANKDGVGTWITPNFIRKTEKIIETEGSSSRGLINTTFLAMIIETKS